MTTAAAIVLLGSLAHAAGESLPLGPTALEPAARQFQDGKFPEALAIISELEKKGEPSSRSRDLRGCILMEQQQYDEAMKLFTAAHEQETGSLAQLHLGDALFRQKKWSEARDAYRVAMKETNVLTSNERLRFAVMMTYLGEKNEAEAEQAVDQIRFPTESAAYYFAQAAWGFAHGQNRDAEKWLKRADEIFPAKDTAWFARALFEFGWLKKQPRPSAN